MLIILRIVSRSRQDETIDTHIEGLRASIVFNNALGFRACGERGRNLLLQLLLLIEDQALLTTLLHLLIDQLLIVVQVLVWHSA